MTDAQARSWVPSYSVEEVRTPEWAAHEVDRRVALYQVPRAWAEAWAEAVRDRVRHPAHYLDCGKVTLSCDAVEFDRDFTDEQTNALFHYLARRGISFRRRAVARECRRRLREFPRFTEAELDEKGEGEDRALAWIPKRDLVGRRLSTEVRVDLLGALFRAAPRSLREALAVTDAWLVREIHGGDDPRRWPVHEADARH